ncbi:hypothetical protein HYS92_02395 [Candidatus Daviesbacteria bacterium]|nr:hypothetical protein [Candidatus Daviesbacteria bacterium]
MKEVITPQAVLQSIKQVELWAEALKEKDLHEVSSFLDEAVRTYQQLEEAAQGSQLNLNQEDADRIKAIWVISAPGTYFKRNKKDRYANKEWAHWADRRRINYGFKVARRLAEIRAGREITGNIPSELDLIRKYGPIIIYNGRSDENAHLIEAAKVPWFRIPEGLGYPPDRVSIINPVDHPRFNTEKYNLLDQIQTFSLPLNLQIQSGDEIGVVAHASQAVRVLYALEGSGAFPAGVMAWMFSLPTPDNGFPEYPTQEIRAMVYYRFIANPPVVGNRPYPYKT